MGKTLAFGFFSICWLITPARLSAQQDEPSRTVGIAATGLRGMARVGVPVAATPGLTIAGSEGYGFTESVGPVEGSHHRLSGTVAVGAGIYEWLALGFSLDGRYDMHPEDEIGKDSSLAGEPRFFTRAGQALGDTLQLGVELSLWMPGDEAPSLNPAASSLDMKTLFALIPKGQQWAIAGLAGFRLDNSANSAPDLERIRPGDRISLGLSDFHAVLLGLGASYRVSAVELLGELSWDILVGSGAPSVITSPLRADAGARYHITRSISFELLAETVVSKRPGTEPSHALVPVEPLFSVLAGIRCFMDMSTRERQALLPGVEREPSPEATTTTTKTTTTLEGGIVDQDGRPVSGAKVRVAVGEYTREVESDAAGGYRFDDVPAGTAELAAVAEGFEQLQWTVRVTPGMAAQQPRRLIPAAPELPKGQIRGLVRSLTLGGRALKGHVIVRPLGIEVDTNDRGRFKVDVPPGTYAVVIKARGHHRQRRRVKVVENGVRIINVDLRKRKRSSKRRK